MSAAELRQASDSWQGILYWIVVEVLSRSSVPLLSVISGWLVAASINRRSYAAFISGKMKSLLAPMAAWNLITVFLIGLVVLLADYHAGFEPVGLPLFNQIIHLLGVGELNYQNAFLRDVFICMLMAPWVLRLPDYALWLLIGGAAIWSIAEWQLYILLRPQILLFFLIGIIAERNDLDSAVRSFAFLPMMLVFALAVGAKAVLAIFSADYPLFHPYLAAVLDNGLRLIAAVVFWRAALRLAQGNYAPMLLKIEPYMFMMFCSHVLIIRGFSPFAAKLFGRFGDPLWPVYFILQPLFVLAVVYVIAEALKFFTPSIAQLLSGGRLIGKRHP